MKFKQKYFQRSKERPVEVKTKEPELKPEQETPIVEEAKLEPTQIKTLEQLMANIVQRHYDQIYKELLAYEKILADRIKPSAETIDENN